MLLSYYLTKRAQKVENLDFGQLCAALVKDSWKNQYQILMFIPSIC